MIQKLKHIVRCIKTQWDARNSELNSDHYSKKYYEYHKEINVEIKDEDDGDNDDDDDDDDDDLGITESTQFSVLTGLHTNQQRILKPEPLLIVSDTHSDTKCTMIYLNQTKNDYCVAIQLSKTYQMMVKSDFSRILWRSADKM